MLWQLIVEQVSCEPLQGEIAALIVEIIVVMIVMTIVVIIVMTIVVIIVRIIVVIIIMINVVMISANYIDTVVRKTIFIS